MRVELLRPDAAPDSVAAPPPGDSSAFSRALAGIGSTLRAAQGAEDAFAAGSGSLQDAIYERARADVAISVAASAAQHGVQALQTILNMQI